jgi:hypothetical protein
MTKKHILIEVEEGSELYYLISHYSNGSRGKNGSSLRAGLIKLLNDHLILKKMLDLDPRLRACFEKAYRKYYREVLSRR